MTFIEWALIVLLLAFAVFLLIQVSIMNKRKAVKQDVLKTLKKFGEVIEVEDKVFFNYKENTYQILLFNVPIGSELTINSKTIWELRQGGSSKLFNQAKFLCGDHPKIVITYPSAATMKRYINENEMVFVEANKPFHNFNLVRSYELYALLEEGQL
jgi:hypothetical protein